MAGLHGGRGAVGTARRQRSPRNRPAAERRGLSGRRAVAGLSPVLLTAPTVRSGTTLLQRLLCSSSNGLIYGEEVGKDLAIQLQILESRRLVYGHSRQRFASALSDALQGDDGWIIDLMPDLDGYLAAIGDGAFAGLEHCAGHAASLGRPLWGFKYPGWPASLMRMLVDARPATKIIYLHRGLAATARSAKAWQGFGSDAEFATFCAGWTGHRRFMADWGRGRDVFTLSFEALLADPPGSLEALCGFLPFENIQTGALERRINNLLQGTDTRHGHNAYIPPAALTASELAIVAAAEAEAAAEGFD